MLIEFFSVVLGVFFATWFILRKLIPVLKSRKIGQKIYDIGPRWHKGKEGTPIMGGLGFIISSVIAFAVLFAVYVYYGRAEELYSAALTLIMALLNALIGFFDDYTKLIKKQNQGFKAWQKFLLQLIVAAAYIWAMSACGFMNTALYIPYFGLTLELGVAYYLLAVFLLTGMVNAVNLTDGIDGLSSSVTAVVAVFFSVCAFHFVRPELAVLPATVVGGTVGFLMYNFYPAKIFMGDTGSLYLGGMVVGMAFMLGNPLIIVVAGLIYIVEVASDILQVAYFKVSHGKRIFKMAPLHHHFELSGMHETRIVMMYSIVTVVCCAVCLVLCLV